MKTYPCKDSYRTWLGPDSNTFVAYVARTVPKLRVDLPPTAVGKDFPPIGALIAAAPSRTGFQLSLFGVLGVIGGLEEGIEVNLLGLSSGLDFKMPAVKLPGMGRIGWQ